MRQSLLAAMLTVAVALVALPWAASAQAGDGAVVVTDPAGDQVVTPGQLVVTPPAMAQVDVIRVSAALAGANLTMTVETSAAITASETVTLQFSVLRGPTSMDGSTASGVAYTITVVNGVADGVLGAQVTGGLTTKVAITFPLVSVEAVGGDLIGDVSVTTQDTHGGDAPPPVTQDDSQGTDRAPDIGGGGPYTIPRSAISPGLSLTITGGTIHQRTACQPGKSCPVTFEDTRFEDSQAIVRDGNATIVYDLIIANTGTDADVFNLGVAAQPKYGNAQLDKTSLQLLHGTTGQAQLTLQLERAPTGSVVVAVQAASTRGAVSQVDAKVLVQIPVAPPPPVGRTPVPEQLGFMTPLATGMGFDKALGDFAELALLALFILLAIVAVYLIMFLTRSPWVRLQVTPKRAVVAPGGTAEFNVRVAPRGKRSVLARGMLRGDAGAWRAGLQMGPGVHLDPGTPVDLVMTGEGGGPVSGTLRVQVPPDAVSNESETVEFDFIPVDANGAEHRAHRAHGKVTVEAAAHTGYASARDIQLAQVRHDPAAPRPGATVTTTATIHNAGALPAILRVVLLLDGKPALEQRVEVPPRATSSASLPWTAGAGKNQVKVQIFLA